MRPLATLLGLLAVACGGQTGDDTGSSSEGEDAAGPCGAGMPIFSSDKQFTVTPADGGPALLGRSCSGDECSCGDDGGSNSEASRTAAKLRS